MKKVTLIINYPGLQMGGIEKYLAELMRYALNRQYRVVWLTTKEKIQKASFKDLADSEKVEKIIVGINQNLFQKRVLPFRNNENVIMLSFEPLTFIAGEECRRKANVLSFAHYLVLPHFTGNIYYIERYFRNAWVRTFCYKYIRNLILKWEAKIALWRFQKCIWMHMRQTISLK